MRLADLLDQVTKSTYPIIYNILNRNTSVNLFKSYKNYMNRLTVIIIPFLKREYNLVDLLFNLHSFLQRQYLHYKIVVAEQSNSHDPFNKGRLYNAAFKYIEENYDFHENEFDDQDDYVSTEDIENTDKHKVKVGCLMLHDVDLIPESDFNIYDCDKETNSPRHLSLSIREDNFNYTKKSYKHNPYELLVGGVLAIKPQVYKKINGFSTEYWNWGAEDDGNFNNSLLIKIFIDFFIKIC